MPNVGGHVLPTGHIVEIHIIGHCAEGTTLASDSCKLPRLTDSLLVSRGLSTDAVTNCSQEHKKNQIWNNINNNTSDKSA
jgi:hypothetical protein